MGSSDSAAARLPLLVGDFYAGADGPTVIMVMRSPAAGAWLQQLFQGLASGSPKCDLVEAREVAIGNLDSLMMECRSDGPIVTVRDASSCGDRALIWSATPEGWLSLVEVVEPLREGRHGHQYLSDDPDDAAVIELSYGERSLRVKV